MSEPLPYEVKTRTFDWEVPDGLDTEVVPMACEIVRLGRRYEYWGDRQDFWRMAWEGLALAVGVPAAVLAGIAGAIALDSGSAAIVGILALSSAALGGILSFLNPSRRAVDSAARARACWAIVMRARLAVAADLAAADAADARMILVEIQGLEVTALESLSPAL